MVPETNPPGRILRFATFEVDLKNAQLRKNGLKLKLQGQPFEILRMLLAQPGELVTRDQLRESLWPTDTFVDFDHGVNTAINRLREALGDSADNPRFIETIPRRGYRFIASVETVSPPPSPPAATQNAEPAPASAQPDSHPVPSESLAPVVHSKSRWLLIGVLVSAALLVLVVLVAFREHFFPSRSSASIQSIAVLPLVNLSNDANQDYFADGLTEALTTDLGKIGALRVISRTSVMQFKGTKKSLPDIARELNVDALIEGSVSRSGNHLRINANLYQTSPEKQLWGSTYESELGDILTVQSQVAQAVAREIQVKLTPQEQKLLTNARSVNPEAHDDYLKGRYLCDKDTRDGFDRAIPYFQKAILQAPEDPLPHAGLAACYAILGWAGDISPGDRSPKDLLPIARDSAQRALQLDENLAEAHTSLAVVEMVLNWNWDASEREFKRAIAINPSYSRTHAWYAHLLAAVGRFDESADEAKRAIELDPLSEFTIDFSEWAYYLNRHYDLGVSGARKAIELYPSMPWPHFDLAYIYEQTGPPAQAMEEYLKAQQYFGLSEKRLAELRKASQLSGEKGYWRKVLEFCQEEAKRPREFATLSGYGCDYVQNADIALIYTHLGEKDAAFQSLEKAYANREARLIYLDIDPLWNTLRTDPRFADLVRRLGLPRPQPSAPH